MNYEYYTQDISNLNLAEIYILESEVANYIKDFKNRDKVIYNQYVQEITNALKPILPDNKSISVSINGYGNVDITGSYSLNYYDEKGFNISVVNIDYNDTQSSPEKSTALDVITPKIPTGFTQELINEVKNRFLNMLDYIPVFESMRKDIYFAVFNDTYSKLLYGRYEDSWGKRFLETIRERIKILKIENSKCNFANSLLVGAEINDTNGVYYKGGRKRNTAKNKSDKNAYIVVGKTQSYDSNHSFNKCVIKYINIKKGFVLIDRIKKNWDNQEIIKPVKTKIALLEQDFIYNKIQITGITVDANVLKQFIGVIK